jgi:hypothetical protein
VPELNDAVHRLESDPAQTDLAAGFTAQIADPAWLLGRQWQLGEHQGEDASSPVQVSYTVGLTPIDPITAQPHLDPRTTPAEAIVESEPGDHWTPGRRIQAGRAVVAAGATLPGGPGLRLAGLPVPYDILDGSGYDGRLLWENRAALGLQDSWFATFAPADPEPADLWNPAELAYDATFTAGAATLSLTRHDGGDLDWYSVDASGPATASEVDQGGGHPRRVVYPGAPAPRWWQIEDAAVDIGGYPPDRAHLGTTLLVDLLINQSDDWFTFPVPEARSGYVVTLTDVTVLDSFGRPWALSPPAGWSLFAIEGLDTHSLVVWAVATTPLAGPVLDEVVLGTDEDANLLWAVEQRLRGRDVVATTEPPAPSPDTLDATGRPGYAYRPMTWIPPHWHPYVIDDDVAGRRRFVQGRAANLAATGTDSPWMPEAQSDLLIDPRSGGVYPTHQLEPAAIPADGVRVERRAMLARATDGSPVLWTQRRRQPLLTPPTLPLRFDALVAEPPA